MEGFPSWTTIGQCGGTDHLYPVQKQLSSKRNAEHIDALTLAVPVSVRVLCSGHYNETCRSALFSGHWLELGYMWQGPTSPGWGLALPPSSHFNLGHWQRSKKISELWLFEGQAEGSRTSYLSSSDHFWVLYTLLYFHWMLSAASMKWALPSSFPQENEVLYCQGSSRKQMAYPDTLIEKSLRNGLFTEV